MARTDAQRAEHDSGPIPDDVRAAVDAALDRKATRVTLMDLRGVGAFADFFLICTGTNIRQVQAIADAIEEKLKAEGHRPAHVEGYDRAEWILLDYFDLIVHVFTPDTREFYALDRLWGTAPRTELAVDAR
ncbi:ribosome silencing factor [Luteitalea sp.]|jgi:ribosome-associated protein|uniref:ribosome silencing factor n=1 Tax=Luteitalea sp. TaxID=2004800 RepID=UPI0037C70996